MFWHRERRGHAEFAVTDARTDLREGDPGTLRRIAEALGVSEVVLMRQVHGADVRVAEPGVVATADALIVDRPGLAAVVRVADCVPVVLIDAELPLGAVVHAGRAGTAEGVVPAAVGRLRERGAEHLHAWIGPHVCGCCYEVPEELADEVGRTVPGTRSTTSWGTPSLDLGGGVRAQLAAVGIETTDLAVCTLEDDRFHSFRRDAEGAGRFGIALALHEESR